MTDAGPLNVEAIVAQAFGCADALVQAIAAKASPRRYYPHTTILHAGDPASHVYLMVEGHAQAVAISVDGRAVLVEDFRPGDLFGEGAALSAGQHGEDVIALDQVGAGQFRTDQFIALMESYSSVALAVSRLVVARLNHATRRMVEGVTLSANGRVHAELLRLAQRNPDGGMMTIRPSPKATELAMQVQSTRETVSRAINLLERKGIIRRDRDAMTIVAPHRLQDLVF